MPAMGEFNNGMITHPDDMVDFGKYQVTTRDNNRFVATFIKYGRRMLSGQMQLHLAFDSEDSKRSWFIGWGSIKSIKVIALPDY